MIVGRHSVFGAEDQPARSTQLNAFAVETVVQMRKGARRVIVLLVRPTDPVHPLPVCPFCHRS